MVNVYNKAALMGIVDDKYPHDEENAKGIGTVKGLGSLSRKMAIPPIFNNQKIIHNPPYPKSSHCNKIILTPCYNEMKANRPSL